MPINLGVTNTHFKVQHSMNTGVDPYGAAGHATQSLGWGRLRPCL